MNLFFSDGRGYLPGDWLLFALVWIALVLTVAILRAPDIIESDIQLAIRRIKAAGLAIMAGRLTYVLAVDGDLMISPPMLIGMVFLMSAICMTCLVDLLGVTSVLTGHEDAQQVSEAFQHRASQAAAWDGTERRHP